MEPLISVIIPAYNIESYIERSLESVCRQTYKNLEIIVVDDGSSDQTGELIDKMAGMDSRIIPIHKQNAGVSAARNTGLDRACGDYIGFIDGDDTVEPDMYELLLKNARKYQADISHCGYQMVFPDRVDYYYNTGEVRVQDNAGGVFDLIKADRVEPGLWNKLYKREVIGDSRLDGTIRINEDLLFNYYLFKKSKKAVFEDVPKYHYMIRENSASTSNINRNKLEDPLLVVGRIMQQETGELYNLLEKRYLYLLEKVSAAKGLKHKEGLAEFQKEKRIELKEILQNKDLTGCYSGKELFQMKLALASPFAYRIMHGAYAALKGSRNKYKV